MTTKQQTLPAEQQFFAIETKGRNGIRDMIHHYQDQLWITRPAYMPQTKKEIYFQKAIINLSNQETLKPLMASREGLFQIYLAICKAVQLGMNIGGIRPHAYIVPRKKYKDGKFTGEYYAVFTPTQDGYRYVVTTGATAIFKDIIWCTVREGYDKFNISESDGTIVHEYDPVKTAKNNIVGVWVKCIRINPNDIDIVKFVSIEKIHNTRDRYSDSYKYAISDRGKKEKASSPWITEYQDQCEKTALKAVLKHYISKCEGLAVLDEIEASEAQEYNNMDISDRMEKRLDNVIDNSNLDPIEEKIITEQEIENSKPEKNEDTKTSDGTLF